MNECLSSPCENGRCVDLFGSFECDCDAGFTGALCEVEIDACESDPCLNGGSCTSERGQFTCTCAADFTGITCDMRIDDCASNPCLNGGTCEDGIADFSCLCAGNFEGRLCDACNLDNCVECSLTSVGVCLQCRPGYLVDQNSVCGTFPNSPICAYNEHSGLYQQLNGEKILIVLEYMHCTINMNQVFICGNLPTSVSNTKYCPIFFT